MGMETAIEADMGRGRGAETDAEGIDIADCIGDGTTDVRELGIGADMGTVMGEESRGPDALKIEVGLAITDEIAVKVVAAVETPPAAAAPIGTILHVTTGPLQETV